MTCTHPCCGQAPERPLVAQIGLIDFAGQAALPLAKIEIQLLQMRELNFPGQMEIFG